MRTTARRAGLWRSRRSCLSEGSASRWPASEAKGLLKGPPEPSVGSSPFGGHYLARATVEQDGLNVAAAQSIIEASPDRPAQGVSGPSQRWFPGGVPCSEGGKDAADRARLRDRVVLAGAHVLAGDRCQEGGARSARLRGSTPRRSKSPRPVRHGQRPWRRRRAAGAHRRPRDVADGSPRGHQPSLPRLRAGRQVYTAGAAHLAPAPALLDAAAFDDYPVIFVSWHQADEFCRFAAATAQRGQWEKTRAARLPRPASTLGQSGADCFPPTWRPHACVGDTDRVACARSATVRRCDGHGGNVWEWWPTGTPRLLPLEPARDPRGRSPATSSDARRVLGQRRRNLRVLLPQAELPKAWADNVGFRCAYPAEVRREPRPAHCSGRCDSTWPRRPHPPPAAASTPRTSRSIRRRPSWCPSALASRRTSCAALCGTPRTSG